jgi:hypothetical protein
MKCKRYLSKANMWEKETFWLCIPKFYQKEKKKSERERKKGRRRREKKGKS